MQLLQRVLSQGSQRRYSHMWLEQQCIPGSKDRKELTHGLVWRLQQNNEGPIQWEISHKAKPILSTGGWAPEVSEIKLRR